MDTGRRGLDPAEVSQSLHISKSLTYKLIREGKLPSIRISARRITIPVAALEKFLSETGKPMAEN